MQLTSYMLSASGMVSVNGKQQELEDSGAYPPLFGRWVAMRHLQDMYPDRGRFMTLRDDL